MNKDAWDRAVDEVGPRLFRYFRYKGAADAASDLVQETFVRLVRQIDRYDETRGPFVAFALGYAQNVWLEHSRKMKVVVSLDEAMESASDDDLAARVEQRDRAAKLQIVLKQLPQVQRDALYFHFDEELTMREIGEILAVPEGTVKSHIFRAKETLRELLDAKEWS